MNAIWLSNNPASRRGPGIVALGIYWLLSLALPTAVGAEEVRLVENGGVFEVPVRINGVITLNFIIDSGASSVQIPADVVLTLLRSRTISKKDFLPGATYTLADGTTVTSPRFMLRHLEISGHKVHNVEASIGSIEGHLLLGQSMLGRFAKWSLDNKRRMLILGDSTPVKSKSTAKPTAKPTPEPTQKPPAKISDTPPSTLRQPIW